MAEKQEWQNSGSDCCSPFSTCLMSWCLPCVTYGRVNHRVNKDGALRDWSFCNMSCCGYCCLMHFGMQWILQMMQRGDIRAKYNLQGNGCKDCLCACFCGPCDLTQQDKEAAIREQERTGLISQQPGKMDNQMAYPPNAYQQQPNGYQQPPPQY